MCGRPKRQRLLARVDTKRRSLEAQWPSGEPLMNDPLFDDAIRLPERRLESLRPSFQVISDVGAQVRVRQWGIFLDCFLRSLTTGRGS